jgi:hypothetical protein
LLYFTECEFADIDLESQSVGESLRRATALCGQIHSVRERRQEHSMHAGCRRRFWHTLSCTTIPTQRVRLDDGSQTITQMAAWKWSRRGGVCSCSCRRVFPLRFDILGKHARRATVTHAAHFPAGSFSIKSLQFPTSPVFWMLDELCYLAHHYHLSAQYGVQPQSASFC